MGIAFIGLAFAFMFLFLGAMFMYLGAEDKNPVAFALGIFFILVLIGAVFAAIET